MNVLDSVFEVVPAGVLWLQDVQQELLDVAGGQLVDVLRWHVSRPDLQLVFHGLDNPSGDPQGTHTNTHAHTVNAHWTKPNTAHMAVFPSN